MRRLINCLKCDLSPGSALLPCGCVPLRPRTASRSTPGIEGLLQVLGPLPNPGRNGRRAHFGQQRFEPGAQVVVADQELCILYEQALREQLQVAGRAATEMDNTNWGQVQPCSE